MGSGAWKARIWDPTCQDLGPNLKSCFGIHSIHARLFLSGGPNWEVKLGREDNLTASQEDSNKIMPSPRFTAIAQIDLFSQFNLSVKDLVALSSSHSIGKARCFSIVFCVYNQSGTGMPDPAMERWGLLLPD
ncbi:hypothetical protein NE237_014345 [Protea cynaroides]|uniref:Plant heme peroxidase family profile domain-containing protein n=1 Tax=Protea cynaroides TaxID=273540 RepID=A0A9Q0KC03_9MAGN|nr:hypothetical protein NE237_014345 [Protea cynaroides]